MTIKEKNTGKKVAPYLHMRSGGDDGGSGGGDDISFDVLEIVCCCLLTLYKTIKNHSVIKSSRMAGLNNCASFGNFVYGQNNSKYRN